MVDYEAISVLIFKMRRGRPYFYLVKRSPEMPIYSNTWTPIAGTINIKDKEVYNYLENKAGSIIDDMYHRLAAIRLMIQRNLLHPIEEEAISSQNIDVYERMKHIDPDILSVYLHSMLPVSYEDIDDGKNKFHVRNYVFISTSSNYFDRAKLIKTSIIYTDPKMVVETNSKWFSLNDIENNLKKPTRLITPSFMHYVQLITKEGLKILDATRKLDEDLHRMPYIHNQVIPFIWKFSTPALTLPPFHTTNIYVVGDKTKYIIDPGANSEKDLKILNCFIDDHIDQIEGIILTSANADHCNQVLPLKKKYDFPIFSSQYVADVLEKEGCVVNHVLKEGDIIQLGPYYSSKSQQWFLKVIDLPGNTPGCIGLWDSRGILFTGSTIHKALTSTPGPYENSYDNLKSSLKKLKKYKVNFGLSGHGVIISNFRKAINLNLSRMQEGENKIKKLLKEGISDIDEIYENFISQKDSSFPVMTRNSIIAYLEKLKSEGAIIQRGEDFLLNNKK